MTAAPVIPGKVRATSNQTGSKAAVSASAYDEVNHWSCDSEAFKACPHVGKAMLRTVKSRLTAKTLSIVAPSAHHRAE